MSTNLIQNAALSGAIQAIIEERSNTSDVESSYDNIIIIAEAITVQILAANALLGTPMDDSNPAVSQVVQSVTYGMMKGRSFTSQEPTAYTGIAKAIVALAQRVSTALVFNSATLLGIIQCNKDDTSKFATNTHNDSFQIISGDDFVYSGISQFALTAEGCIVTYTGPDRSVLVDMTTSVFNNPGSADHTFGIGISKDGDLDGAEIYGDSESLAGVQANNFSGDGASCSTNVKRKIDLTSGTVFKPVGAKETGNADMMITALTMVISAA